MTQAEGDVIRFPLAEKEPADFSAFFAEEHRELFKALFFVTGNRADAAELMQDAFLKLWERWDHIDRIADLRGYLFRVALNGFRMRARPARQATRRLVPLTTSPDPFDEVSLRGGRPNRPTMRPKAGGCRVRVPLFLRRGAVGRSWSPLDDR